MRKLLLTLSLLFTFFVALSVHASAPFPVSVGGTGVASFTAGNCILGNGTSPLVSAPCPSSSSNFPFTAHIGYNSTTTVIGFNGLFSTASSTFSGPFHLSALSDGCLTTSSGLVGSTGSPCGGGTGVQLPTIVVAAFGGNTTSIQTALNTCATLGGANIYLTDTTYAQGSSGLRWKGSNCAIWGRGPGTTTITFTGATTLFKSNTPSAAYEHDEIHNLTIAGDTNTGGVAIDWSDMTHGVVDDLLVTTVGTSIVLNDTQNATFYNSFTNLDLNDNWKIGINASSTNPVNANIFSNIFIGCEANCTGVQLDNGNNNQFIGVRMEPPTTSGTIGLKLFDNLLASNQGATDNIFQNIYVEGNGIGIELLKSVNPSGGVARNSFIGGISDANTTNIIDQGTDTIWQNFDNNFTTLNQTSPLTVSSQGSPNAGVPGLQVFNNTSFAQTSLDFAKFSLLNSSDTANLFNLSNLGTGATIIATSTRGTDFILKGGKVGIATSSPFAALSVAGQSVFTFFTATSTAQQSRIGNFAGVLDCDSFPGSDEGIKLNNCYAAAVAQAGSPPGGIPAGPATRLTLPAGKNFTFSTPINFNTDGVLVTLDCQGSSLTYTGSGSTVALTVNTNHYVTYGSGIENCSFIGPGSAGSTVGIFLGGTHGAFDAHLENVSVGGFGLGIHFGDSVSFLSLDHVTDHFNGQLLLADGAGMFGENNQISNSTFADSDNQTGGAAELHAVKFVTAAFTDYNISATSFDDAQLELAMNGGIGDVVHCVQCHFENPAVDAAYDLITMASGQAGSTLDIAQSQFAWDDPTHAQTEFILNGGNVNLTDTEFVMAYQAVSNKLTRLVTNQNTGNTVNWKGLITKPNDIGTQPASFLYGSIPISPEGFGNGSNQPSFFVASSSGATAGFVGIASSTPWKQLSVGSGNTGRFAISTTTGGILAISPKGEVYSTGSLSAGSTFPFTPTTNFGVGVNATTSILWFQNGIQASSTSQFTNFSTYYNATSTIGNFAGILDANSQPGANEGVKINNAYAQAKFGTTITLPSNSNFSFSTPIVFATSGKVVTLDCQGSTLTYTGTGSSIAITVNTNQTGGAYQPPRIQNCRFVGPSDAGATVGLFAGGTIGSAGLTVQNVVFTGFGVGTQIGDNSYLHNYVNVSWIDNGVNIYETGTSNVGERMSVSNSLIADCPTSAGCVHLTTTGGTNWDFNTVSFDDAQLYLDYFDSSGGAANTVNITNSSLENPQGDGKPAYDFIEVLDLGPNVLNVVNSDFINDATASVPGFFIDNGGVTNLVNDSTLNNGGAQVFQMVRDQSAGDRVTSSGFVDKNNAIQYLYGNQPAGAITFGNDSVTSFFISTTTSGFVGFGTTTPSAFFSVSGVGYFDTRLGVGKVPNASAIFEAGSDLNGGGGTDWYQGTFSTNANPNLGLTLGYDPLFDRGVIFARNAASTQKDLEIGTPFDITADTFFKANGNIGLSTSSPFARVSIVGIVGSNAPLLDIDQVNSNYATSSVFKISDANVNGGISTTTVSEGVAGDSNSRVCHNSKNALGANVSWYIGAANTIVIEAASCK